MKSKKFPKTPDRIITVDQLVTVSDLQEAKVQLISEIKNILETKKHSQPTQWLKSHEVKELLQISTGKLHALRTSGHLPFTKLGRVIFYNPDDIQNMLQSGIAQTADINKQTDETE